MLIDSNWDIVVKLDGFAGLDGLTIKHMCNHFLVLRDDGELGSAIKVLVHIHLESDDICAAVN